jgi:hypothetical protein
VWTRRLRSNCLVVSRWYYAPVRAPVRAGNGQSSLLQRIVEKQRAKGRALDVFILERTSKDARDGKRSLARARHVRASAAREARQTAGGGR